MQSSAHAQSRFSFFYCKFNRAHARTTVHFYNSRLGSVQYSRAGIEMARKGLKREFEVDGDMESASNATVHGVVTELSPIKLSRNNAEIKYFSARLSSGSKAARIISFKPELRSCLEKSKANNSTVALVNCQVREGKFNDGLEIVASSVASTLKSLFVNMNRHATVKTDSNSVIGDFFETRLPFSSCFIFTGQRLHGYSGSRRQCLNPWRVEL